MSSPSSGASASESPRRGGLFARGPRRAKGFEALASCILAGIIITVSAAYYLKLIRLSREAALQSELRNIRVAVQLFTTLNSRFPESLEELLEKRILLPDREMSVGAGNLVVETKTPFTRSYLQTRAVDPLGRPLDPFGKPYRYNPKRGLVRSGNERYKDW